MKKELRNKTFWSCLVISDIRIPRILFILFFSSTALIANAQRKATLSGYIKYSYNDTGIAGVNVVVESLDLGTSTNTEGYFELTLPLGLYGVTFTKIGLEPVYKNVDILSNTTISVEMRESIVNLDEVTIFAEGQDANLKSIDVGKSNLESKKIKETPAFLGEADIIRTILLLPGVSTVGEGSSGFNVRGGSADQNLILQDGAPVFNPSHVFGFFTAFNPSTIKNSALYKGSIPSNYGGRISSVLDVDLKEGDFRDYNLDASVGIVTSKVAVDGPIAKNKLSFMVGGRISYADWILNSFRGISDGSASFYDGNVKLTYRVNNNNRISYSGYTSFDSFAFDQDTTYSWSTTNHVINSIHILSDAMLLKGTLYKGIYKSDLEDDAGINAFKTNSQIDYTGAKALFEYDINESHKANFGASATLYEFLPGDLIPLSNESGIDPVFIEEEKSLETALFIENTSDINSRLTIKAGLRFNYFANLGEGTDFLYGSNGSFKNSNIVDTIQYEKNELIAAYNGLNPRLGINFKLTPTSSIKVAYNRTQQFIHLVSNTSSIVPTDIWKTSNLFVQPTTGDQYSIGVFKNLNDNSFETSIEAYYKTSNNIVDFKNGAAIFINPNIEADLIQGKSYAYGLEMYLRKRIGSLSGWVSYTHSRAFRKIDGFFPDEVISNGDWFPANYDKPHDFTFTLDYNPNRIFHMGVNFTYNSGRPVTNPLTTYELTNISDIFLFSKRNQGRIPNYHRLDFSMTFKSRPRSDKNSKHSFVFAIYNLYGRKNAYSVFYENQFGRPPAAYKYSVLGSVFPSITFNYSLSSSAD